MILELIYNVLFIEIIMLAAWVCYLYSNNPGVIDLFWAPTLLAMAILQTFMSPKLNFSMVFMMILCGVWALRLSGFLFVTRVIKGYKEKRYRQLSHKWKNEKRGFLINFLFQGVLIFIISIPFYLAVIQPSNWGLFKTIVALFILLAIFFQTQADWTLYQFAKVPKNKLSVCNQGWWYYSRHPNYFFEICIWLGFALLAFYNGWSILSLLSPLTVIWITYFITGPITEERSILKRGDEFKQYQAETSYMIPWFKRGA